MVPASGLALLLGRKMRDLELSRARYLLYLLIGVKILKMDGANESSYSVIEARCGESRHAG